jgi:hypothetical protein
MVLVVLIGTRRSSGAGGGADPAAGEKATRVRTEARTGFTPHHDTLCSVIEQSLYQND